MTIQEVIALYKSVYYLEDDGIIPLVLAIALAGKLGGDAIWLMIVGPSSGGKTEIINAITGVDWVHQVSTLTANTFLSGMKNGGQETSLLKRIGSGVMTMKDFTTILAMPRDLQQVIFAQLREIYDGHMVKETGTGVSIKWDGKINLIAGTTEKIHVMESKFSGMGTRALQYTLKDQDRIMTTRRAQANAPKIKEMRNKVRDGFTEYLKATADVIPDILPAIGEKEKEEMMKIADFATIARSPVERGFKGDMELVLSAEMPMRMSNQMYMLGGIFSWMYGDLTPDCQNIIIKVAFDSIPKQRRITLRLLAEYARITTKGMAVHLKYPTDTVRKWLEDCNALGLCDRQPNPGAKGDFWVIKEEFRALMAQYDGVKPVTYDLAADDDNDPSMDELSSLRAQAM